MKLTKFHIKVGKLAAVLALLLIGGQVWGATYYVNGSGAQYVGTQGTYAIGNDTTGTGTLATPWATIQKSNTSGSNSDTVYVAAGAYAENDGSYGAFVPSKNITWRADGPVTIRSATSTVAAMRVQTAITASFIGPFTFDGEGTRQSCVYTATNPNLTFTGPMTFSGTTTVAFSGGTSTLTLTDPTIAISAGVIFSGSIASLSVVRPTINMSGTATNIYAGSADNQTLSMAGPGVATISGGTSLFVLGGGGTASYTISGMEFNINANVAYLVYGAGAGKTNSIAIRNNQITLNAANTLTNYFIGLLQGSCALEVTGNTINQNNTALARTLISVTAGEATSAHTATISGNTITNLSAISSGACAHIAVGSNGGTVGFAISGNTDIADMAAGYIYSVGSETTGANDNKLTGMISNNSLYGLNRSTLVNANPTTHGLFVGHNKGIRVTRNLVIGSAYGAVMKHSTAAGGTQGWADYNKFVNCKWGVYSKGYAQLNIANNTIYSTLGYGVSTDFPYGLRIDKNGGSAAENVNVKNNIIVIGNSDQTVTGIWLSDAAVPAGFECDYNGVYFLTANERYGAQSATSYAALANWRTFGYGANDVGTDPLLTAAYSLQSGSPASGAGVLITGLQDQASAAKDFAGVDVIWGPSIGAYHPTGAAPIWAGLNGAKLLRASQAVTITGDHSAETLDLSNAVNTGTLTISAPTGLNVGKIISNADVLIVGSNVVITAPIELGDNVKMHGFRAVHQ